MKNTIKNTMLGISIFLSMSLPLLAEANSEGTGTHERTRKCLYNAAVLGSSQVQLNGEETNVDFVVGPVDLVIAVRLNDVVEEESSNVGASCDEYLETNLNMQLIQVHTDPSAERRFRYMPGDSIKISFESRWGFEFMFKTWAIVE